MKKAKRPTMFAAIALGVSTLSGLASCVMLIIVIVAVALPAQTAAVPVTGVGREAAPEGRPTRISSAIDVEIDAVRERETTVVVGFTVVQSGPQALFFDVPDLDGQRPTAESLERARVALLDAVAGGEAAAELEFPMPQGGAPWMLTFNPSHEVGDHVAPRIELEVSP
jgi:hypothetical protein